MISSSYWVNPWKSAMSCAWFLTWSLGIILINLVNADLWSMTYNLRWHQQTGRVRTFGNPLLHKSNENTGKIVRIKTSKLWKLIKGLKWFLEHLFKKKRLNFGKNIEFYGILTCLNLTSSSIVALKTSTLRSWKWTAWQPLVVAKWIWNSFKIPFLRGISLFNLSSGSLAYIICKAVIIWPDWEFV